MIIVVTIIFVSTRLRGTGKIYHNSYVHITEKLKTNMPMVIVGLTFFPDHYAIFPRDRAIT